MQWPWGLLVFAIGTALQATVWQTILQERNLAGHFMSEAAAGTLLPLLGTPNPALGWWDVAWLPLWLIELGGALPLWLGGAAMIARRRGTSWDEALATWGLLGGLWWFVGGSWELCRLLAYGSGSEGLLAFVLNAPEFWQALRLAGAVTTYVALTTPAGPPAPAPLTARPPRSVWLATGAYVLCFATMNLCLYHALQVPHGDSAMYEEHLWNLLHGKGFRSYLDQGLFLGEHVQVVHLLAIPVYVLWPSHQLLEILETLALALGAWPVYQLTLRRTGSIAAATSLAWAYLLYFPMQRLDIAIDLKTFRPEAFGIPLLLAFLNAADRLAAAPAGATPRLSMRLAPFLWGFLTYLVKEDYAIVFAPWGLFWAASGLRSTSGLTTAERRRYLVSGLLCAVLSTLYLLLVIRVVIPYFRPHQAVHYLGYFSDFGRTLPEILWNLVTRPGLLFGRWFTAENALYALALLAPLGFLPLLSPGRLAVAAPLFGILCLNQIPGSHNPQHHFHAPLVALLFWAAADGLARAPAALAWVKRRFSASAGPDAGWLVPVLATWGLFCASFTGTFLSLSPLGTPFWDVGSRASWRTYVPGPRAAQFAKVAARIPPTDRVASTDFIHPRFTHHDRSYDYSSYRPNVPPDAEWLVIDVRGPYSQIRSPADVPESRDPAWELLPDETEGYFYVFRRRPNQ